MRFLVVDGNSILNRAFYGIKILTTKDGRFTNGIYGFLNMLLKIEEEYAPQAVAVAFDLPAPTFRHQLYADYKAGRKGMPEELAQQLPVLKELLDLLGYSIVVREGYEADDILGTLAKQSPKGTQVYLATGDRDSFQLVDEQISVLYTATKMGRPQTVCYDPERILAEYRVTPPQLLDIKALMGDSSDNIPGVAGIGQKTAGDLISRFGSVDALYEQLDALDIKPGVKEKLRAGRESCLLSRELGKIDCAAPIETDPEQYSKQPAKGRAAAALLADLEMFQMIGRLKLDETAPQETVREQPELIVREETQAASLLARLRSDKVSYFTRTSDGTYFVALDGAVVALSANTTDFPLFEREFFEDENIAKYACESKGLYSYALQQGLRLSAIAGDAGIMGYLLNPNASEYSVQRLAQEYGVPVPQGIAAQEAQQAAILPALFAVLREEIEKNGQTPLLADIEMPLIPVLAQMEHEGFAVDKPGIAAFGSALEGEIDWAEQEVYNQVGYRFNLNSPKQLGEALFEKLGIPAKKKTKTGFSTNAEALEGLQYAYPVVADVLQYRTLTKLKSTYCDGLVKVIGPDGRIRSTLNQTETRTGRISSTEPNLQNIPVRSDLGRELRRFFRAKEGCVLVDADYSQIELRVLAHIAQDTVMLEAFNQGQDIHTITASQVFRIPPETVTPLMRSRAKAVNFGIVYGISAFSLSQDIGVTRAEADRYIKSYLEHYAGVRDYMERVTAQAKEHGYAQTLFGRRRSLPELHASDFNTRAFGERVARNMPIQGTAADIIKLAMIRVSRRLEKENLLAKLILQVHDELIVEAPLEEEPAVARIVKEEMEAAAQLDVALCVDVHSGQTWYDAKG